MNDDDMLVTRIVQVAAVLKLHHPIKRWLPYPDSEWSYETEEEARDWDDDTTPTSFTVCAECARIEMGHPDDEYDAPDYDASLWPCATAKACGITE